MRAISRRAATGVAALLITSLVAPAPARAQFIPYFGKNKVRYDTFDWRVYRSPHFEVYYYPEFEQHLARVVSYMESGYRFLSSELKHEIAFSIPIILYKTSSEFQQTNLFPSFIPEGVLGFTEPVRDRMVLPIDLPPDELQGLITHELTHVFEFDLIPRSLFQRTVPLWVDEGLASYMEGKWSSIDLMQVRDAAVADQVPSLSRSNFQPLAGRAPYNFGHAAFEFIESRYGKEGIRQFLYTLRKNLIGGGVDSIYQQAFRLSGDEFDKEFEKWLKARFKPFRDKQTAEDYGRSLAPNSFRTPYALVLSYSPSPSGEMAAALTVNRSDQDIDLVLLSTRTGGVIKNLTPGYTGEYQSIHLDFMKRSIDFSPRGDAIAFFARTGKRRSLFLVSPLNGKILERVDMEVDQATGPAIHPDGRRVAFSAVNASIHDIYIVDIETGELTNVTRDGFADSEPRFSPDGKRLVYVRRISGHEKLYSLPLDNPEQKTQLTFGIHDDVSPIFTNDGNSILYSSDEDDDIFNLRSLDLRTGVIAQYTDVLSANMVPAPLPGDKGDRIGFITFHKGEYALHAVSTDEPMKEVDQQVMMTSAEDIIDFQPDISHQIVTENKRRKGTFEGMYLQGRPPLNIGVTSSGDFFGGSQIALTDVLGDQNVLFTVASVRQFRSYSAQYSNQTRRLAWGVHMFDNTQFFFASPFALQRSFGREGAIATRRITGALGFGAYPISLYHRLSVGFGAYRESERFDSPEVEAIIQQQCVDFGGGNCLFNNGTLVPITLTMTGETTRFRQFGPLTGSTYNMFAEFAPPIGGTLTRRTFVGDARKYLRLGGTTTLLAFRAKGWTSRGDNPALFYFGGNQELRGYPYLSFTGNEGFFANAELRFPIIDLAATPLGLMGPVRGTFFFGIGSNRFHADQTFEFSSSEPGVSFVNFDPNDPTTFFGEPVSGFHLVDGRASYGFGLQVFFGGYPLHFDWTKFTDLKVTSRNARFDFWVGYDF